jgi:nitrite reductase/ring-hydroxylating ferredoxin subunit
MRRPFSIADASEPSVLPSWMAAAGWYVIGWSGDVAREAVVSVTAFGQDLVLYRGTSGDLHCLDAHCQHLGAHLGHGGRVAEDCVVCPFHGWTWGPDGQNIAVPQGRTSKRRTGVWPVCERNGIIYLWHDVEDRPPQWEMPDLFDDLRDEYPTNGFWDAHTSGCHQYGPLTIQPRMAAENVVDLTHFRHVHGTREIPTLVSYEIEDFSFMTKLRVASRGRRSGAKEREDTVTLKQWGVGCTYTRFSGRDNVHSIFSVTPVDAHRSILRQTIFLERLDGETDEARLARMNAVASVYPEDVRIWQHQRFVEPPSLQTDEAALFRALRSWLRAFEPKPGDYGAA